MAEPTTTTSIGIYSLFILIFGVVVGQYALIVFAALAGGIWAVSNTKTLSKRSAVWLLFRVVVAAIFVTGGLAAIIETTTGLPVTQIIAPVAFLIGFLGDRWNILVKKWADKFVPSKAE